jgi:Tol biopolymer transport system component
MVFSAKVESDYFHIYIKNPYSKTFTQITTGSSNNTFPSLSADKKKIIFVSDRNGSPNIYVLDLDKTFLVAQITDDKSPKYLPRFSPDGKSILYTVKDNGKFTLVVVDLATKIKTFLGEGIGFSWTQDYGIIFTKPQNNKSNAIWSILVEKLNISQIIYDTEKTIVFPSANLKGNTISYSKTKSQINIQNILDSNITDISELYISDIADTKKTEYQILNDGYTNFNPIVAGERIYFISDRSGTWNIWSLKVALENNK